MTDGPAITGGTLVIATTNPGQAQGDRGNPRRRAGRAADAGGLPRRCGAGRDRRDVRRERPPQGALLRGARPACPAWQTIPGSRSPRSATCPAFTRPAGTATDYAVKFAKIRERLLAQRGSTTSAARFVCRVALADQGRVLFEAEGIIDGEIAPEPRGDERLRIRPHLFLSAVQPHARRSPAGRKGDGQSPRPRLRGTPYTSGKTASVNITRPTCRELRAIHQVGTRVHSG